MKLFLRLSTKEFISAAFVEQYGIEKFIKIPQLSLYWQDQNIKASGVNCAILVNHHQRDTKTFIVKNISMIFIFKHPTGHDVSDIHTFCRPI